MPDWVEPRWLAEMGAILAGAFAAALTAAWLVSRQQRRVAPPPRFGEDDEAPVVLLFDGEHLLDASDGARQLLGAAPGSGSEWSRLRMVLLPRFPELETRLSALGGGEEAELLSADGGSRLRIRRRDGVLRLALADAAAGEGAPEIDRQSLAAMERELETLRAAAEVAPFPVWRQSTRGQITWVNRAYLDLVERVKPEAAREGWPPPALFAPADLLQAVDAGGVRRLSLEGEAWSRPLPFDCVSHRIGDEVLFIAADVSAQVQAETQLREFRQTLTKTFAHLTIGLAIFDRSRQLALFNPALTDLTRLPIDFLAARPTLHAFLDRLREKKMMPEPKDYKSWRRHLVELETAAAEGSYAETWSMPAGQTYRVTGRPHPDGAVAFLFEDISAEISLARRFRTELEMSQAVLDSLDEAIAVFSPDGVLAMANRAYSDLWGTDPTTSLNDIGLVEATETWSTRSAPSPIWNRIRDFATGAGDRTPWRAEARLTDGRGVIARVAPLAGGSTLVGFRLAGGGPEQLAPAPAPEEVARRRNA